MPDLWLIFTTGLLAGGVSCAAVQGGLLASVIAQRKGGIYETGAFLIAKLVSHLGLGLLLGAFGSVVVLSPQLRGVMLVLSGVFMLGVGLDMLGVHPMFRRFAITPPRFLSKWVRGQSKGEAWFAPIVLGLSTVFIPCGTTLAMMVLAMNTANPILGAVVMGTFVVGTSPLFLLIGVLVSKLGEWLRDGFRKIAAYSVVVMALGVVNNGLVAADSPLTAQKVLRVVECTLSICKDTNRVALNNPTDQVTIRFTNNGYEVDNPVVKAGSKVKVNLVNVSGGGCIQAFSVPKLGVSKIVSMGKTETIELAIPDKPGELSFSCSMGMFNGTLTVI